jgi:hypothetical protein
MQNRIKMNEGFASTCGYLWNKFFGSTVSEHVKDKVLNSSEEVITGNTRLNDIYGVKKTMDSVKEVLNESNTEQAKGNFGKAFDMAGFIIPFAIAVLWLGGVLTLPIALYIAGYSIAAWGVARIALPDLWQAPI